MIFPPEFIGFAGHFPGYPILPAIVQMLAAQVVIDCHLGRETDLVRLTRAKFMDTVLPDQRVKMVIRLAKSGAYGVEITKVTGEVVSRFYVVCN